MNLLNVKGLALAVGLGLAVGGAGSGFIVHSVWKAKDLKGRLDRSEARATALVESIRLSAENREHAAGLAAAVDELLGSFRTDLADMIVENGALAARRFDNIKAHLEEVENLRALPNLDPCMFVPIDERLLDNAFGGRAAGVPISEPADSSQPAN